MRYHSARAFRQALERRLRALSRENNVPLMRLRKQVAFERFLARLQEHQPENWILKGGLALQLRLGIRSRTTKDIDLFIRDSKESLLIQVRDAASLDLADFFTFEVSGEEEGREDDFGGNRYHVRCLLDGRNFERFHIDIGTEDIGIKKSELFSFDPILEFAGLSPTKFPCYPVAEQIAEKIHALTREYGSGMSTRTKDFVDVLLLAKAGGLHGNDLSRALRVVFSSRDTHELPASLPPMPDGMKREYTSHVSALRIDLSSFKDAEKALSKFINPVLKGDADGTWNPDQWKWE